MDSIIRGFCPRLETRLPDVPGSASLEITSRGPSLSAREGTGEDPMLEMGGDALRHSRFGRWALPGRRDRCRWRWPLRGFWVSCGP